MSRASMAAMYDHDYENAIRGYEKAIEILQADKPQAEEVWDLELAKAEAYRRAGKFEQSQALLNRIKPTILSGHWADPLLVARFWRRQRDLDLDMKDIRKECDDQRNVVAVVERSLEADSNDYLDDWVILLSLLSASGRVSEALDEVKKFRSLPFYREKIPPKALPYYNSACQRILSAAMDSMGKNEMDRSAQLMEQLDELNFRRFDLLVQWNSWADLNRRRKQGAKNGLAEKNIYKLIGELKDCHDPECLHALVIGHFCLAGMFAERKNESERVRQWTEVRRLVLELGPDASPLDKDLCYVALVTMVGDRIVKNELDDTTLSLAKEGVERTEPKEKLPLPLAKARASYYCALRSALFHIYYTRNQIEDASKVLDEMSRAQLDLDAYGYTDLCANRIRLADGYVQSGQKDKAKRQLDEVQKDSNHIVEAQRASYIKRVHDLEAAIRQQSQTPPPVKASSAGTAQPPAKNAARSSRRDF